MSNVWGLLDQEKEATMHFLRAIILIPIFLGEIGNKLQRNSNKVKDLCLCWTCNFMEIFHFSSEVETKSTGKKGCKEVAKQWKWHLKTEKVSSNKMEMKCCKVMFNYYIFWVEKKRESGKKQICKSIWIVSTFFFLHRVAKQLLFFSLYCLS